MTPFNLPKKPVASILGNAALTADILRVFCIASMPFEGGSCPFMQILLAAITRHVSTETMSEPDFSHFLLIPGARPTYEEAKGKYLPPAVKSRKKYPQNHYSQRLCQLGPPPFSSQVAQQLIKNRPEEFKFTTDF